MVTYYAMSDSIYGPFETPEDNILDGTGFCFYAAKTAEFQGTRYLCGYAGFAFGQGDEYGKYAGLVLDAKNNSIHYEGCVLSRIPYVEPVISTDFAFE